MIKRRIVPLFISLILLIVLTSYAPAPPKKVVVYGIDISHHNGTIDWKKLPKDVQFVYIKATEGRNHVDDMYSTNVKKAREQGFKVGSYHFFHMRSSAHSQFNNFKKVAKKSSQDLIPMVYVEVLYGKSTKALRDSLLVFCNLCKKHYGKSPMIYASTSNYNDWLAPTFNKYHLYIACYNGTVPVLKGSGTYTIWQFSERGNVPGASGNCDLAIFNKKYCVSDIEL